MFAWVLLIASCALYVSYDVVLGKFTYICGSFGNLDYPQIIALWSVVFLLMPMYLALRVRGSALWLWIVMFIVWESQILIAVFDKRQKGALGDVLKYLHYAVTALILILAPPQIHLLLRRPIKQGYAQDQKCGKLAPGAIIFIYCGGVVYMVLFLLHQVIGTPAKEVIIGAELFVFYFYILTVLLYIPFVYDSVATETTEEGAKPKDPSLV